MFTPDEARSLLAFLDRCPTTGHKERIAMNHLVTKIAKDLPAPTTQPDPAGDITTTEGTGDEASGD